MVRGLWSQEGHSFSFYHKFDCFGPLMHALLLPGGRTVLASGGLKTPQTPYVA